MDKRIIIIGGGPAGLTAALELARKGYRNVTLCERESQLGGISRTLEYKGNHIDIGGHRFFSKSERVMNWWAEILPLQGKPSWDDVELGREATIVEGGPNPDEENRVMLIRSRLSRILFLRKFFKYPVTLSAQTLLNLGPVRVFKMGVSYIWSTIHKREEKSLEDFFINRFGKELYNTFFRDYTAKVWGVPCSKIGADWGAQRVKGLSVAKVLAHACGKLCFWKKKGQAERGDLAHRGILVSQIRARPTLGAGGVGGGKAWRAHSAQVHGVCRFRGKRVCFRCGHHQLVDRGIPSGSRRLPYLHHICERACRNDG